jgi:dipeptidase E
MKILLTSAGLTNKTIINTLSDLVGKKPEDTNLVFIPTASNVEEGDKGWLIDDLLNLKKQNFKQIEIVDISALPIEIIKKRFEEADILYFEGGNTNYLMDWINRLDLKNYLIELLKSKVWVGVSAGSMVTNPTLDLKTSQYIYGEDFDKTESMDGLNFVNFYSLPHINSPYFVNARFEKIEEIAKNFDCKIYAIDDNSAIKIVDDFVEVAGEGVWKEWN